MEYYGLIGKTLTHSFSKAFFEQKFAAEKIDASYELFPLSEIEQFNQLVRNYNFKGLNVTIPYKEQILKFLDKIDSEAEKIGAVNVIKFQKKGDKTITTGYNSDITGFKQSLLPLLKPQHTKALVLGTGGASKAVCYVLEQLNITYRKISRQKTEKTLTYNELNKEIIYDNKLIINTTPLGTFPKIEACPKIPYQAITTEHLLFDLIYNPAKSLFLQQGEKQGAIIKNGHEMLIEQALESWRIWNQ